MTQLVQTRTSISANPAALLTNAAHAVVRYARYRKTLRVLRDLPYETLWDLDIDPGKLKETARRAAFAS